VKGETMQKVKVFYDNKRGVRVTGLVFSTRLKDEQLSAIVSVKVGREPLYIAGTIGLGLIAFGLQFDNILDAGEQMGLIFGGAVLIAAGYSVASLTVGTLFNDKAVWWYDYWTIQKVRRAIRDAKHVTAMEEVIKPEQSDVTQQQLTPAVRQVRKRRHVS
jgi:hypothetical protein